MKSAHGKFFLLAVVLLYCYFATYLSAMSGLPLSNKLKIQALAQEQLINNDGEVDEGNNITTVASFNASEGQLPEGMAMTGDNVFVSFAPQIQVIASMCANQLWYCGLTEEWSTRL